MLAVAVNLNRLDKLYAGEFRPSLDVARMADSKGVDQIVINDHIGLVPAGFDVYPHGTFPNKPDSFMAEGAHPRWGNACQTARHD